jgi:hypothetical protein
MAKLCQKAKLKIKNVKKDFLLRFSVIRSEKKKGKKRSDSYYFWFHCVAQNYKG